MTRWFFAGMLSAGVAAAAAQSSAPRSVWDGVYTEAQAQRGEKVAGEHCARCHGQTLGGAESAPALVGDVFNANWENVLLGDLFERIRISMPQDNPGSLSRQQNADVIAYLLKLSKMPVGESDLPTETVGLARITFVSNRPQP